MGLDAQLSILGLTPGASPSDVRRAYRRLALRHHPDRHGGAPAAQSRFARIAEAYRVLLAFLRSAAPGDWDVCAACRRPARLYALPDGRRCCGRCALGHTRRLLPHPAVRIVRFYLVAGLWVAGSLMLARAAETGDLRWHGAALGCALAGLTWLAFWSIRIADVYDPRLAYPAPPRRAAPPIGAAGPAAKRRARLLRFRRCAARRARRGAA